MDDHYSVYEEKARKIFASSIYMVIGTSTKDGKPWVAPVLYVHDKDYCLYFLSAVDALHAKNILNNPEVSISIFDSHQKIGFSDGIQIDGTASLVERGEIKKAITLYCAKVYPNSDMEPTKRYVPDEYLGVSEFRFFKVKPINIYVTGEDRHTKVEL